LSSLGEADVSDHDDREDHGGGADHRRCPMSTGLAVALRCYRRRPFSPARLGVLELHVEAVAAADLRRHVRIVS